MNYSYNGDEASSDESGKGDFFGGIAVCALYLDSKHYNLLKSSSLLPQITDSKNLSDYKIKEIAPKLLSLLKDQYIYKSYTATEYNLLYSKFKNLNILLSFIHNSVWTELKSKKQLEKCITIIDAFTTGQKYNDYLKSINIIPIPIKNFCTKAESKYLSCALASIIARFLFISQIETLCNIYNLQIPFGNSYSPSNSVIEAFNTLKKRVSETEIVNSICKSHFKTLSKIRSLY